MRVHSMLAMGLFAAFGTAALSAALSADEIARVWLDSTSQTVGIVLDEKGDVMRVLDLKTCQERSFPKAEILKLERNLTDEQAAKYVGLAPIAAHRVQQRAVSLNRTGSAMGKVAQVTPTAVYVTLGKSSGVEVGHKLSVFRPGVEIKDPDTGSVLARERPKVATLNVFEVQENLCKARLPDGLETILHTGDEVDGAVSRFIVAVLPIADESGVETVGGNALREEIVTALVKQNVPIVERSQLATVFSELSLQNVSLFDSTQAQNFGKQLGASMVVTGKVIASGSTVAAHVRLVNVSTGEIVLAVSGILMEGVDAALPTGKALTTNRMEELMKTARLGSMSERKAAVRELGDTKSPVAAKFLAEEMITKDPFTTPDVLISMGPVAADALAKVIENGSLSERSRAMKPFAKIATQKHLPLLQRLSDDIHLRSEAQAAIRRIQNP